MNTLPVHHLTRPTPRLALGLIVLLYLSLALFYSFHTPLLEAPDAYYHFGVAEHIGRTGQRPPTEDAHNAPWGQVVFHAPLYYYLTGWLMSPIDTSDFPGAYPRNPHARIGEPDASDNENFVAHTDDPWRGSGLAIRLARGVNILLGIVTLVSIYTITCLLSNPRPALLATLLVALIPQFAYMHGVVSNDPLVTALSTLGIALVVWLARQGVTTRRVMVLSVVLGLAALAKASGLVLLPVAGLGVAWAAYRQGQRLPSIAVYGLILGLGLLLICGWWYIDNYQQHGDPFATTQVAAATGLRDAMTDPLGELRGLYFSFWGLFGWFNIRAPLTFYHWTAVLVAAGLAGLVGQAYRHWRRLSLDNLVLAGLGLVYAVAFIGAWWRFNTLVLAAQGRLWFPLLGLITPLLAWGLSAPRLRWLSAVLLGGLIAATLAFPLSRIAPAYAPPLTQLAASWTPPAEAVRVDLREPWANQACLTLWVTPARLTPDGQQVLVDFRLQTRCPLSGYWSEFVHLVDLERQSCQAGDTQHILTQYDTMPAGGDLPLPALSPGQVFMETLAVDVPPGEDIRTLHVQMGFYDAGGSFVRMLVAEDTRPAGPAVAVNRCAADTLNLAIH